MSRDLSKPLWIPLRREWFIAFRDGGKGHEWRLYGPRWNEDSCFIGRPVTLSLGYTRTRLSGVVVSFDRRRAVAPAVAELYGKGTMCAVIGITLT